MAKNNLEYFHQNLKIIVGEIELDNEGSCIILKINGEFFLYYTDKHVAQLKSFKDKNELKEYINTNKLNPWTEVQILTFLENKSEDYKKIIDNNSIKNSSMKSFVERKYSELPVLTNTIKNADCTIIELE